MTTEEKAVLPPPSDNPETNPRRIGQYFGSDRCCHARLCTWRAYEQASREAAEVAARLGPGWVPNVSENLGWHYSVKLTNGDHALEVHPRINGSAINGGWEVRGYSAHFDHTHWQESKTPEGAVVAVIAAYKAEIDRLGDVLAQMRRTLLTSPLLQPVEEV